MYGIAGFLPALTTQEAGKGLEGRLFLVFASWFLITFLSGLFVNSSTALQIWSSPCAGRRMCFICLANTLLDDRHACLIARALQPVTVDPCPRPSARYIGDASNGISTRDTQMLQAEPRRAGVNLLLSDPNRPALSGF